MTSVEGAAMAGLAGVLRTPDERFEELPSFPFAPHYVAVANPFGDLPLRMHYIDEGPSDAQVVLALHGAMTWSYLYRTMIPELVTNGFRVVAPDLIGFGRSDKLVDRTSYSVAQHVAWVRELVRSLELSSIILVCQGWGGPIGLAVLAREAHRFDRVVAGNITLPTCSRLAGRVGSESHAEDDRTHRVATALLQAIVASQRDRLFQASLAVARATVRVVPDDALAAYDAPFPDERFKQGMRQFPVLEPLTFDDPGALLNRETLTVLARFEKPFLTLFGDSDPATRGWERILQERIPGTRGQPHTILERTGHCWPEDGGHMAARLLVDWLRDRGGMRQRPTSLVATAPPRAGPSLDRGPEAGPVPPPHEATPPWQGMADTRLTWEKVRDRGDIRLYAGDIPFFRLAIPGLEHLYDPYHKLVGLSINRHDAYHLPHELGQPLPLPDDSVSFYQSEDVFHYLPFERLAGIVDEIHRVLRPGALLRLSFPDYGCDVLRERCMYDVAGRIVFDPGVGGSPQSPSSRWFGRIDMIRALIETTRFATHGTVEYLHYYEMDGTPITRPIDYSKGHVARTPDHDRRVMEPYRPMSMVIDLTKHVERAVPERAARR